MVTNIFVFFLVLGGLIFLHELGHFLAAKFFGVGVEKFSLGFGPRIFGRKIGITDYRISAIPLGGYVKMIGDDPDSELDSDLLSLSFTHKHVLKRIAIVLAGPVFNVVFAVFVFFIIFSSSGVFVLKPIIGDVMPNMPAETSGLQSGDIVLTIDKKFVESWDDMAELISSGHGTTIEIGFERGGILSTTMLNPLLVKSKNIFGQEINKYAIGVISSGNVVSKKVGYFEAIGNSFIKTYEICSLTVTSIIKLLQGAVSTKTMGGPIMIAEMAGHHAKAGVIDLMFFVALLSINLAVLNCLPIPVLDGGHLAFFTIEAILGRPVNIKIREFAHQVGAMTLLLLMIYVFYNDIIRLFFN